MGRESWQNVDGASSLIAILIGFGVGVWAAVWWAKKNLPEEHEWPMAAFVLFVFPLPMIGWIAPMVGFSLGLRVGFGFLGVFAGALGAAVATAPVLIFLVWFKNRNLAANLAAEEAEFASSQTPQALLRGTLNESQEMETWENAKHRLPEATFHRISAALRPLSDDRLRLIVTEGYSPLRYPEHAPFRQTRNDYVREDFTRILGPEHPGDDQVWDYAQVAREQLISRGIRSSPDNDQRTS